MKKYTFLIKPLLFIFNLLFASWFVLEIEKINPSNNNSQPVVYPSRNYYKQHFKKVCFDYKSGLIDSVVLDKQLEIIVEGSGEDSTKN